MGKSHQKGWIILRGKKWYGYFRREVIDPETNQPKATIVPVVLGTKSELSKFEAKEALEREITRVTGIVSNDRSATNVSVTFGWFVRNRFFPFARWTLQLIPHRATPSQTQESECRLIQRYGKRVWTGFSLPKMLHSD